MFKTAASLQALSYLCLSRWTAFISSYYFDGFLRDTPLSHYCYFISLSVGQNEFSISTTQLFSKLLIALLAFEVQLKSYCVAWTPLIELSHKYVPMSSL